MKVVKPEQADDSILEIDDDSDDEEIRRAKVRMHAPLIDSGLLSTDSSHGPLDTLCPRTSFGIQTELDRAIMRKKKKNKIKSERAVSPIIVGDGAGDVIDLTLD